MIPVAYLSALTVHRDFLIAASEALRPVFTKAAIILKCRRIPASEPDSPRLGAPNCFCPSRLLASKGLRLTEMSHLLLVCCREIWQVLRAGLALKDNGRLTRRG